MRSVLGRQRFRPRCSNSADDSDRLLRPSEPLQCRSLVRLNQSDQTRRGKVRQLNDGVDDTLVSVEWSSCQCAELSLRREATGHRRPLHRRYRGRRTSAQRRSIGTCHRRHQAWRHLHVLCHLPALACSPGLVAALEMIFQNRPQLRGSGGIR